MKYISILREERLLNIAFFIMAIIFFITGLFYNKMFFIPGIIIIILYSILKDDKLLFVILIIAYISHNSHFLNILQVEITNIYYILAVLIIISNIYNGINNKTYRNMFLDKYLYLMGAILVWGILSSITSIQSIQSLKNTLSIFLVFIIFYTIPRYFYSEDKQLNHFTRLAITLNIIITIFSILNILFFYEILIPNEYLEFWRFTSGPYKNPNTYGTNIMLALMISNLAFVLNDEYRNKFRENVFLKSYIFLSYLLLIINLLISSSRASILGTAIAFLPFIFKYKKAALAVTPIVGVFLLKNKEFISLFRKIESSGLSGRGRIWSYAFNKVIAKHPILGIGSGASHDFLYKYFGGLSVHNSYINTIMSIGIAGFILWIGVIALIFYKAFHIENKYRYIFICTILGIMGYAFFELGLFEGLAIKKSLFWTFVLAIEYYNTRGEIAKQNYRTHRLEKRC